MANPALRKLIQLFLKAETDIVNEIGRLRSQGLIDYHAAASLDRVQGILDGLVQDAREYVPQMVEHEFYVNSPEAARIAEPAVKHAAGYTNAAALSASQHAVVDRLVEQLMGEVLDSAATVIDELRGALIGRRENDIFRRAGLEFTAYEQARGRSALNQFVQTLARDGVTAFIDSAGRRWSLHAYGAMISRTTSRQAQVMAVLTADPEHDLYRISSHNTTCKLCAPFEGRVYSRSGKDPDFPPLAAAFGKVDPAGSDDLSNTWLNIHPNCLHIITAWTPAGRSEAEIDEIKNFSNPEKNPFSVDPRSKAQIEAYRDKERARSRWLADYKQWERYRITLGERVPKSFSIWQKYKSTNSEKYRIWKLDYRRQRHLAEHPENALPNAQEATAADAKFTGYFFNRASKEGYSKGIAFSSRLGYNVSNWELFRGEILAAATKYPARYKGKNQYGNIYEQKVVIQGRKNNPANMILGWLVSPDGTTHLTTAYMEDV